MARSMSNIEKYRDFLKERIDTDKILDCLMAKTILSKEEVDEVKSQPTMCKKNEKLLDIIIEKEKEEEFIDALGVAKQRHLAYYLLCDGDRNLSPWDVWPLLRMKIEIIDVNFGSLKDLIDFGGGLVDILLAKRVINYRHKQLICSKATDSEKTEAFLDILRRGSMDDYENTIQCLRDSNQDHIAEILDKGGAVMPVHAELQEPLAEVRLAERITDLLRDRTVEESRRILEMATHKLIAAKAGHSVIFYFYCKTSELWQELKKAINSESLIITIEELCQRMDSETNVVIKAIQILDRDQEDLDKYFAIKDDSAKNLASEQKYKQYSKEWSEQVEELRTEYMQERSAMNSHLAYMKKVADETSKQAEEMMQNHLALIKKFEELEKIHQENMLMIEQMAWVLASFVEQEYEQGDKVRGGEKKQVEKVRSKEREFF